MKREKSALQLPFAALTPVDVRNWATRRWQDPTIAEATRWLVRHRTDLQKYMANMLANELDELLDDVALDGYPDPRVGRLYRRLDRAIYTAAEAHGDRLGKQMYRWAETDYALLQVADLLLREEPKNLKACLDIDHEFCEPSDSMMDRTTVHRTRRVHLSVDKGKLGVELVEKADCRHGDVWFVPQSAPGLRRPSGFGGTTK